MLLNGVDLPGGTALTSAVPTDADLDATVKAFANALAMVQSHRVVERMSSPGGGSQGEVWVQSRTRAIGVLSRALRERRRSTYPCQPGGEK